MQKIFTTSRRQFLATSGLATAAFSMNARAKSKAPLFQISLAQWTINRELKSGNIDNLDFAKTAHDHGIHAIEYVNQFFMDKAKDEKYLAEMKKRAADLGVKSLMIMCDREGNIGDPDEAKRNQTVENHRKWIGAAKFLGCHSIRVNAGSSGTWEEQVELAADGLAKLTEHGAEAGLNVIVENHGGLSSNGDWLAEVMKAVRHERCGTLPDFGNFRIKDGESYDSYRGIKKLMPWAKGVSVKDRVWDDKSNQSDLDYDRMLKIVLDSGFRGYCGIEHGGFEGLNASRKKLEAARDRLAANYA
ncbi:MAG: sugar phosphate isomerase/epimerase [Verrucomicrobiales bacterium]|nr:sugar phosphate isomerase/epimerase [Verrucomicrobiales bacterium]